jgi:dihydroorotase-like cyclic amidohydrolase
MDLVMIDEEKEMIYTNNTLRGRAINTPYYGMALRGDVDGRYIL